MLDQVPLHCSFWAKKDSSLVVAFKNISHFADSHKGFGIDALYDGSCFVDLESVYYKVNYGLVSIRVATSRAHHGCATFELF